ncbi:transcriptional regulator GcvA [Allomesorhizobium camelthorni]|nr:transcriptional regulator GcvA [Mesorhizobium camelthorni]NGO53741.1 transcriptional regulator GcvA [Mesorhizobium camelthorni]
MSYRLPPLNALKAFEAAARLGSFSRAADELCVTQGAISRHIKILEESLETKLFRRVHRQVHLTEEGLAYSRSVREAFAIIETETANLNPHYADRIIRIKALPTFAMRWLIPRLSDFTRQYPEYEVSIQTSHKFADFEYDDLDGSIEFGTGNWKDVASDLLFPTMLTPVCSPRLADGAGPPQSLEQLPRYVLLHSKQRPDLWNQWLTSVGATNVPTKDVARLEDSGLVYQAAIDGLGLAIAEFGYVKEDIRLGRLVKPFDYILVGNQGYYFVCLPRKLRLKKVAAFRKWIMSRAEETRSLA